MRKFQKNIMMKLALIMNIVTAQSAQTSQSQTSGDFHSLGCFYILPSIIATQTQSIGSNSNTRPLVTNLDSLLACSQTCATTTTTGNTNTNGSLMALSVHAVADQSANCVCLPQSTLFHTPSTPLPNTLRPNSDCSSLCFQYPCGSSSNSSLYSVYTTTPVSTAIPNPNTVLGGTGAVNTVSNTTNTVYAPGTTDRSAIQRKWAFWIGVGVGALLLLAFLAYFILKRARLRSVPSKPRLHREVGKMDDLVLGVLPRIPSMTYTCHTAYTPMRSDEVRLSRDDVVQVIEVVQEGEWALSNNLSSGSRGIHPLVCLVDLKSAPQVAKRGAVVFPTRK